MKRDGPARVPAGRGRASGAAALVTDAVVLRLVPYGEADLVVTLFTRALGKVSALARGARRSRRRYGAALALFIAGEAELRERRGAELAQLDRFDARQDHTGLAADLVQMAHASYGTELVRELTVPRQPDPAILDLLVELYATTTAAGPRADTLRAFELRLLQAMGLRPVLDRCLACGGGAEALDRPGAILEASQGGAICGPCAARAGTTMAGRALPAAARARLVAVQDLPLAEAAALSPLAPETAGQGREAVHGLLAAHLGSTPLRSLEFLQKLRGS